LCTRRTLVPLCANDEGHLLLDEVPLGSDGTSHTPFMTRTQSQASLANPSPALGLSVLGLALFVLGGLQLMNLSNGSSGMARTGTLILLGLGLFATMVGSTAMGVRLARSNW
jgi:hypothetical protein